jgi:hypothetical protein
MQLIESIGQLGELRTGNKFDSALLDLVEGRIGEVKRAFADVEWDWDPEEHGAFAILEDGDDDDAVAAVGLNPEQGLAGATWESCYHHVAAAVFEILILLGGDTGWTIYVPDAAWVAAGLRAKLTEEAVEPTWEAAGTEPSGVPF